MLSAIQRNASGVIVAAEGDYLSRDETRIGRTRVCGKYRFGAWSGCQFVQPLQ